MLEMEHEPCSGTGKSVVEIVTSEEPKSKVGKYIGGLGEIFPDI